MTAVTVQLTCTHCRSEVNSAWGHRRPSAREPIQRFFVQREHNARSPASRQIRMPSISQIVHRMPTVTCHVSLTSDVESRIALAASTGSLDLSDCGLEELPTTVTQLTDLVDLSLAGNRLTCLPAGIGKLTKLRRLGLAGNLLRSLPPEIGQLTRLQGLWLHGNLLSSLPDEIGSLHSLRFLALAGNCLRLLPTSLCRLPVLEVLSVAGNCLEELPQGIGAITSLTVLAAYGNNLTELPPSLLTLPRLQDLWLQGNHIAGLPSPTLGLPTLPAVRQLSLADNCISSLTRTFLELPNMETLWLYGNQLQTLPPTHLGSRLKNLWLEGNPLSLSASQLHGLSSVRNVGIDTQQQESQSVLPANVAMSRIAGSGAARSSGGYFKLQPWEPAQSASLSGLQRSKVLVVAFGSAPGVPNWAGLLRRLRGKVSNSSGDGSSSSSSSQSGVTPFDTLYIVDSTRSWYTHPPLNQHSPLSTPSSQSSSSLTSGSLPQQPDRRMMMPAIHPSISENSVQPSSFRRVQGGRGSSEQLGQWELQRESTNAAMRGQQQAGMRSSPLISRHTRGHSAQHSHLPLGVTTSAGTSEQPHQQEGNRIGAGLGLDGSCYDGEELGFIRRSYYEEEIAAATEGYERVVMLGDSMGATGALMHAGKATAVVAFSPQVNLLSSSIRPGRDPSWLTAFSDCLLTSLQSPPASSQQSSAPSIGVHCGTWSHDVEQAKLLENLPQVTVTVHPSDSHRVAKDLDTSNKLACIVSNAINCSNYP